MANPPADTDLSSDFAPWYAGITRYQWLVLIIASLGWVFDVFEGQYFVASMNEAMPSLVEPMPDESESNYKGRIGNYNSISLGAFLLGGAVGGIFFGMLSDRIGRKKAMTLTIIFYSLFTCLSAFAMEWWHLAVLRFFVAMGVGGEWAVASSLVFEVFPARARAHVGGIFHASSVLGTYLAIAAGTFLIGNPYFYRLADQFDIPSLPWRIGFALGVLPALLIIWIRVSLHEPEEWKQSRARADANADEAVGRISHLFSESLLRNTLVGFCLAAVGMATFWGVHVYGKDLMRAAGQEHYNAVADAEGSDVANYATNIKRWEMLGMLLVTTGGGIGLLSFGPISQRIGRRAAFTAFHLGGFVAAIAAFQVAWPSAYVLGCILPIFGFLTLGMHAGYAIYFPELFPTRLRGTGTGFCFNAGRIAAAPILVLAGYMLDKMNWSLARTCTTLSFLYLLGVVAILFAPETVRRREPAVAAESQI